MGIETILLAGSMAAGTMLQMGAQMKQGEYAARAAEYNARVLEQEAQYQIKKGQVEKKQFLRQGERVKGQIRSGYGASGVAVNAGSPMEVLFDTEDQINFDAALIEHGAELNAWSLKNQAGVSRYEGELAKYSSRVAAGSTLLTSALGAGAIFAGGFGGGGAGASGSSIGFLGNKLGSSSAGAMGSGAALFAR